MEQLKKVYPLYFVHEFEDGHDEVILLGVFSSKEKAKTALSSLAKSYELKTISKKLIVDESTIDRLNWFEGYTTIKY